MTEVALGPCGGMLILLVSPQILLTQRLQGTQLTRENLRELEAVILAQVELQVEVVFDFGHGLGAEFQGTNIELLEKFRHT